MHRRLQLGRPFSARKRDGLFDQRGGVDQVIAFAFDHLQRHGIDPVKARGAFAVFKREPDQGQITQSHHAVAIGFDRQVIDIAGVFE